MASPFEAAMAAADAVLAGVFGEDLDTVLVQPRVLGELSGSKADATRPAMGITGVFTLVSLKDRLAGVRQGTELTGMTKVATAEARLWLPAAQANRLGYLIRNGDRIVLSGRPGAPAWEVVDPGFTDIGDYTLSLVRDRS